jgi:hypothetical protein
MASAPVGYCGGPANVNPRRTYFHGTAVTQQRVQAVCHGGKYMPGSGPNGGGAGGAGAATGGRTGSGGSGAGGGDRRVDL